MYQSQNRCSVSCPLPPEGYEWYWHEDKQGRLTCGNCDFMRKGSECGLLCLGCEKKAMTEHYFNLPVLRKK